jgi:hypothetical protein
MANWLLGVGGTSIVLSGMLTTPAAADRPTASEIVDGFKSNDRFAIGYMQGLLDGYNAVNHIEQHDNNALYCPPNGLVITIDQADDILSRYLKKNPITRDFAADFVFIAAFKEIFPCAGGR